MRTTESHTATSTDGGMSPHHRRRTRLSRETKPSLMTSEFWLGLVGVGLLVATYLSADDESLNLFRTCLLATILGAAYTISRGIAKSGSHNRYYVEEDGYERD